MRPLFLLFLLASTLPAAHRWVGQFYHDVDGEEMKFSSIAFCSPTRGVAVGALAKSRSFQPVAVVTSNGGRTWTQTSTDEHGYSLFFFDETAGWMLTPSGIWFTDECGRSWRRIHKQPGLQQIRFVSRERGWAVGMNKTMIETSDGGKTWTAVKAAVELAANAERTTFAVIAPASPREILVVGRSNPSRINPIPLWLDPHPQLRRELPAVSVSMETYDGGETWKSQKSSMFGRISAISYSKDRTGLLLIEFNDMFEYASELYTLDARTGTNVLTLRRKDFAVTDIAASTGFYAAGFQPSGAVYRSPIPGKVRIAFSADAKTWQDCEVDYRAVANRVTLAESGGRFWAATDTGMILNLVLE